MAIMTYHGIDIDLALTEIRSSDADSIVKYINDPMISANTLHIPYPYYDKDAEEFLNLVRLFEDQFEHVAHYAIRYRDEMVGGIGFLYTYGEQSHIAEIGYWIGESFRNRGLMTRVIKKMVEIGFSEKGLFRIEANVFVENQASMRVLEKAGFEKEGLRKARFIKGDKLKDAMLYAIIRA